jgi:RNA polymerase sigma factor (sigma-70 family)
MMSLCVRYTKNEIDARSILNTGFLKVFRNIHLFDPAKATFYTWIRTIVVNCCLDHIKIQQGSVITDELQDATEVHIEPEINAKLNGKELLSLIRNLPAATQAVFNLYIMEGYGHKEIGMLLQISEGTSKWHLSEARKNLKLQLQQEKI